MIELRPGYTVIVDGLTRNFHRDGYSMRVSTVFKSDSDHITLEKAYEIRAAKLQDTIDRALIQANKCLAAYAEHAPALVQSIVIIN